MSLPIELHLWSAPFIIGFMLGSLFQEAHATRRENNAGKQRVEDALFSHLPRPLAAAPPVKEFLETESHHETDGQAKDQ
jgi:hypothetical protein